MKRRMYIGQCDRTKRAWRNDNKLNIYQLHKRTNIILIWRCVYTYTYSMENISRIANRNFPAQNQIKILEWSSRMRKKNESEWRRRKLLPHPQICVHCANTYCTHTQTFRIVIALTILPSREYFFFYVRFMIRRATKRKKCARNFRWMPYEREKKHKANQVMCTVHGTRSMAHTHTLYKKQGVRIREQENF